ncbi:MAG: ATP synthase F1 subunit epsilon [Acidimicrobiia bacterium]
MSFRAEVVTPESTVLSDEAVFVLARGLAGDVGILEGHAPMLVGLGTGKLEVHRQNGSVERFLVDGGFMEVSPNKVIVLADVTEHESEIDVELAKKERDRLLSLLASEESDINRRKLKMAEARVALAEEARARGK